MADRNQEQSGRSSYRESLIEKRFLADLLTRLWPEQVEVLRSEVDIFGYDLVLEARQRVRHVQLKSTMGQDSVKKGRPHSVNARLGEKPAGCVLWIVIDSQLEPLEYRWLGAEPGKQLDLSNFATARHAKPDRSGVKRERPEIRAVPRNKFKGLGKDIERVVEELFGREGHGHSREPTATTDTA